MLGWSLFSVDEDGEDGDAESERQEKSESELAEYSLRRGGDIEKLRDAHVSNIPPPKDEDSTGWQDAAWLLSVASKVLL